MPKTKVKPSRWYYVLACLVLGTGLTGFVWFLFSGLSSLEGGLTQLVVPGDHELTLSEMGGYTVFHEYQSVVGNKVYSMAQGGLSGLQCSLAFKATGEEIPLSESTTNSTYSMGSRSGVSIFDFRIDSPGTYVFSAQYFPGEEGPGEEGPEAVLSVGHGFVKQLLVTILGGLGIIFGAMGAAAAIAVITFVRRRRARKQLQQNADPVAHPG